MTPGLLPDRSTLKALIAATVVLGLLALALPLSTGALRAAIFLAVSAGAVGVSAVFWPEALVMAYLFAGRYGYEARLAPNDLPLSLNQMFLVAMGALALVHGRHVLRVLRSPSIIALLGFGLVMVLGLGWTRGPSYGLYKVARTWFVIIPAVVLAATLVRRRGTAIPLILAAFGIGLALNTVALVNFQAAMEDTNRLTGLGSGPNVFSRTVGLSLLIALLTLIYLYQRKLTSAGSRVLFALAGLAFLWLLPGFVFAQSRGPALSLIAAIALVLGLSLYKNWRAAAAALVSVIVTAWGGSFLVGRIFTHTRFDLTKESNFASVDSRVELLWDTWDMIIANPLLGVGTGGWPVEMYGIDIRSYPHSLFAEIAAENGLVYLVLMLLLYAAVVIGGLVIWARTRAPLERFVVLGALSAFVYFLINVQISGDSVDNRIIWLTLALVDHTAQLARQASRVGVEPRWTVRSVGIGATAPSS